MNAPGEADAVEMVEQHLGAQRERITEVVAMGAAENKRDLAAALSPRAAAPAVQLLAGLFLAGAASARKTSQIPQASVTASTAAEAMKRPAAHPEIIATSSEGGLGMDAVRMAVLEAALA